jgi:hypothetical protein
LRTVREREKAELERRKKEEEAKKKADHDRMQMEYEEYLWREKKRNEKLQAERGRVWKEKFRKNMFIMSTRIWPVRSVDFLDDLVGSGGEAAGGGGSVAPEKKRRGKKKRVGLGRHPYMCGALLNGTTHVWCPWKRHHTSCHIGCSMARNVDRATPVWMCGAVRMGAI